MNRSRRMALFFLALAPLVLVSGCDEPDGPTNVDDAGADGSTFPSSCSDGVLNGFESDVDCGGLDCPGCTTGLRCTSVTHCASHACVAGLCVAPSCTDTIANGSESDVDCGGSCDPCDLGDGCRSSTDCVTHACSSTSSTCVEPTCFDGTENDTETDVDCGGGCVANCADTKACGVAADCQSGVCTDQACTAPSCVDHVVNGSESDEDCGGGCDDCVRHQTCGLSTDCETGLCHAFECVLGPSAGFTLDRVAGEAPLAVTATSAAVAGDGALASTQYDFGAGFAAAATGIFDTPGSFFVRQRVTDAYGFTAESMVGVEVAVPSYSGTYFSTTDKAPEVVVAPGGTTMTIETIGIAGVRSTRSVAPGSGVYYFEATIPEMVNFTTIGVATSQAPLDQRAGENAYSFGIDTHGQIYYNGNYQGNFDNQNLNYGFVVDYRGVSPIVRVITVDNGSPMVISTIMLTSITTPVFVFVAGARQTKEEQVRLNAGNDTTNWPFAFDPVALMTPIDAGAAAVLVRGFGGTRAFAAHAAPTLSAPSPTTIALGQQVTLSATASDAEDGNLTSTIFWEDLATGIGPSATSHVGSSFTFTPNAIGVHPVRLTVVDAGGKRARAVVDVTVTGTVAQLTDVRLVTEATTGSGIGVSPDGHSAHYSVDAKHGIRGNQGLYGDFWYFEATRLGGITNQGVGLVIGGVSLDPYPFNTTPPSCSINSIGGTWRDLMFRMGYNNSTTSYGYAVDYRGRYPIAYVIALDGAGDPTVVDEIHLVDVTVPVFPMLYGNLSGTPDPYDVRINFGETAFTYDPVAVIGAWDGGVDTSELQLCWGNANAGCPP